MKKKEKKKSLHEAAHENIAAIGYEIGGSKLWRKAYDCALADRDGFTGFYSVSVDAGVLLEKRARKAKADWGVTHDWLMAVDCLANKILKFMIDRRFQPVETSGLLQLVDETLEETKEPTVVLPR